MAAVLALHEDNGWITF